jgi:iron complex outermembrane receptor protein
VSLGATYVYTDKQVSAEQSPFGVLPSSNLLNLNLNWDGVAGLPVDLGLFVTNVTKEEVPLAVGNSWASGFETFVPNMPRLWGARLKYRFGN